MFLRAVVAFLVLPGVVAILVPVTSLWLSGRTQVVQPLGLVPLVAGFIGLLWCVRDFYVSGKGTLAPWAPPAELVTVGLYRYSRNPMYIAVASALFGWAFSFRLDRTVRLCGDRTVRVPFARCSRRGTVARTHAWRSLGRVQASRSTLAMVKALVFTAAVLLAGCTSVHVVPYPERWPPLVTAAGDCAAVSGRYRDKGEYAEPSQALFTLTLFGFRSDWSHATEVLLQADAQTLRVNVFNGPTVLFSRSFTQAAGDYSCATGAALIRTQGRVEGEGVSGNQTSTVQFFAAGDFVVVHVKAIGSGVSELFMPGKWTTDNWARFGKVAE